MVSTSFIPVEIVEVVAKLSGRELASLSFPLKCNNGGRFVVNCRTGYIGFWMGLGCCAGFEELKLLQNDKLLTLLSISYS